MMEDRSRKIGVTQCLWLLSIGCFISQLCASDVVIFHESFEEKIDGRWIVSEKHEYSGVSKHEKSEGHDDYGLLVNEQGRKYAIVKELDQPVDLNDGTIILQYDVRLENGLECGGAYIKYLQPQEAGWIPKEFDNESPYTIIFGPDKCGATNKVQFILKHKNPKSGKYVEHHLKFPPSVPSDKLTHVYTSILKPNNELSILIDGEEKKKANFLSSEDFEPPLIPSKSIPGLDNKKPENWEERAKISDPDATKPENWDEDAPMEIEDEKAEKPEGWLDDGPEEVEDPEAAKLVDDEEDGEREAPKIDNPKCEEAPGCGEWKRPMKRKLAYKGKWHAPLIDDPNYKGISKPRDIDNPEYFELEKAEFEPIAAIGIEFWTMQDGVLFIKSEKVAESLRVAEKQKEEDSVDSDGLKGVQKLVFGYLYKVADLPFLGKHKIKVLDLLEKAEKLPNLTIGVIVSIVVIFFSIFLKLIFGGKKPAAKVSAETEKTDVPESSNNQGSSEEKHEQNKTAPRSFMDSFFDTSVCILYSIIIGYLNELELWDVSKGFKEQMLAMKQKETGFWSNKSIEEVVLYFIEDCQNVTPGSPEFIERFHGFIDVMFRFYRLDDALNREFLSKLDNVDSSTLLQFGSIQRLSRMVQGVEYLNVNSE